MNSETVVFAHAPSEDKGWSKKSPDWWGADCCSACHDVIDGRRKTELPSSEIYSCQIRGVYRTIKRRIEQGLIHA
jgi:sugar (pentulose or hexulose) kinase